MSDQPKHPVETPREWFRYSDDDLAVAEREMQAEMPVYHIICFLCQGAAEKTLKGYLIAQGWALEKTHDILKLLKACSAYEAVFDQLVIYGELLNEYITVGRYPGDVVFESIGRAEAEEALQATQAIKAVVVMLMRDPGNMQAPRESGE